MHCIVDVDQDTIIPPLNSRAQTLVEPHQSTAEFSLLCSKKVKIHIQFTFNPIKLTVEGEKFLISVKVICSLLDRSQHKGRYTTVPLNGILLKHLPFWTSMADTLHRSIVDKGNFLCQFLCSWIAGCTVKILFWYVNLHTLMLLFCWLYKQ